MFNPALLECARYSIGAMKMAFVPVGADPAAMGGAPPGAPPGAAPPGAPPGAAPPGGAPPMDPAAMGGAPPGGAPPMDPAAMGGAPPMDPAAMGMAPPGGAQPMDPAAGAAPPAAPPAPPAPPAGGMDPEMIRSIIREEMANGGGGAGAGAGKPKAQKVTPEQAYQEAFYARKMLTHMYGLMGWGLPPDILDAPPPGQEAAGGGGGSPGGGSPGGSSGGGKPAGGQAKSAMTPISPISALQGAFPTKAAGVVQTAEALLHILQRGQ